jgi:hypothetical protein
LRREHALGERLHVDRRRAVVVEEEADVAVRRLRDGALVGDAVVERPQHLGDGVDERAIRRGPVVEIHRELVDRLRRWVRESRRCDRNEEARQQNGPHTVITACRPGAGSLHDAAAASGRGVATRLSPSTGGRGPPARVA